MFKLEKEDSRLNIASKIFGWKKAEFRDVARELQTTEEQLLAFTDDEYLEVMFMYADTIGVCSWNSNFGYKDLI